MEKKKFLKSGDDLLIDQDSLEALLLDSYQVGFINGMDEQKLFQINQKKRQTSKLAISLEVHDLFDSAGKKPGPRRNTKDKDKDKDTPESEERDVKTSNDDQPGKPLDHGTMPTD